MRSFFLFFFLLFLSAAATAQQARQYVFKHFSVVNGLASSMVYQVTQDRDGFIWMATSNGLQRYDGNSFLTFSAGETNPSGIPDRAISSLFIDRKGHMWASIDNEVVGIFDTKHFVYHPAKMPRDEAKFTRLQHFRELQTGELLLIKDSRRLLRYVPERNEFIEDENVLPRPAGWKVTDVRWDTLQKAYWIACDSGMVKFDPVTRHISYRGHNTDNDPGIASFGTIRGPYNPGFDHLNNLYFMQWIPNAGAPTIFYYNRRLNTLQTQGLWDKLNVGYHEIFGTLMQRNGRLWLYGMPFLGKWNPDRNEFDMLANEFKNEQSIKFDYAFCVFEDRENNIWVGTDNGVFLFNPEAQVFNSYILVRPGEKPLEPPVQAVAETADDRIFVGCWGLGLFVYDKNFNPLPVPDAFKKKYSVMSIWDMTTHSRTKKLWILQQGGDIDVYDPLKDKGIHFSPEIFAKSTIRQVDEDTSGNLWFGTQSGKLIKWDYVKSGGDPQKGYELIYQGARVLKVHYDYQGFIWVAGMGDGLAKIDVRTNKVVHRFSTASPKGEALFMDAPSDMTYYNDTTLLVAAGCLNIINTRTNKVSFFSVKEGLPSNDIQSIQRDHSGIVWMGMGNGICRLNFGKRIVSYYDRRDGILFDRFAGAGVEHLSSGQIVLFTDHNFMTFDPKQIAEKSFPPKPYITSFRLAGVPLSLDSMRSLRSVSLAYNTSSIAIDFSALSFLQQTKLHYFYKMENLDKDWIHTDHPIQANYNYLPPGEYVFKVKSENVDGVTNPEIASIPIVVRAPFWKTWWFYSLMVLTVIAVLYVIDRERIKRRKSLQQVRTQIRSNLRDEVSNTLNNINVLSEIAKIKADKNVNQAKDFIDQISDKSRYMMEALDDTLWSIDPANDSMRKFVLRIKELTDNLRSVYGTEIDLIVDNKMQTVEMDMKMRHELFFFYKETMNFLVENIPCNQVFVNLNKVKSKLLIEILSECNVDTEDLKQKFRQTVQKRVRALQATMDVIADHRSFSVVLYINVR